MYVFNIGFQLTDFIMHGQIETVKNIQAGKKAHISRVNNNVALAFYTRFSAYLKSSITVTAFQRFNIATNQIFI